ncbi:hypothetical protein ACN28G_02640 [Micromonospora sp. WMMA1923]|uniref:Uncharacterized protein n=1 Tax=Micromonospora yangpuensis TaxID=683228 RepID=A0A1C6U8L1_9ACTN|nr:hypothetical protein GCM10012279_03740 [Micromonospora yangpuensis]SCL50314.1 hypothetical protein GA0070617_1442 [Micromonospora yangpuensis]
MVVCLVGLVAYLGREAGPEPETRPAGPEDALGVERPASAGRPAAVEPAVVSPGLNPRARPAPDPTPSATPSAPASAAVAPAAQKPVLAISRVEVPAIVDLTDAGARDWIHWGARGAESTVRKRAVPPSLVDAGGRGDRAGHDTNPERFVWRDGAEMADQSGTSNGVHTCGAGNGFTLAVAGDGEVRTVRLFVGVWMARGQLAARLADGTTATVAFEDPHTEHTAAFDVRFRAPAGQRLTLSWVAERAFNPECGSVSLQAAALR